MSKFKAGDIVFANEDCSVWVDAGAIGIVTLVGEFFISARWEPERSFSGINTLGGNQWAHNPNLITKIGEL
jgi:hypothetical protein